MKNWKLRCKKCDSFLFQFALSQEEKTYSDPFWRQPICMEKISKKELLILTSTMTLRTSHNVQGLFSEFRKRFKLNARIGLSVTCLLSFLLIVSLAPASYSFSSSSNIQQSPGVTSAGVSAYPILDCASGGTLSCNWAGYYAIWALLSVTMVNGSWIQPSIKTCSGVTKPEYTFFAVGIEGAIRGSDDTIQVGTAVECSGTSPTPNYFAWYEVWDISTCPSGCPITSIPITGISPGDIINAQRTVHAQVPADSLVRLH